MTEPIISFAGMLAVVTGGGTGMGRELVRQLAAEGCDVAMCDVDADAMAHTAALVAGSGATARVSSVVCDVTDETQMVAFRDSVAADHGTDHIEVLFNNAGIGGAGSFVTDDRSRWERTFDVCWRGVYLGCRTFLPMLERCERGAIVNTASVNGFWASIGTESPHTAYSAAKFAVKGFTEALITDLRVNAPHITAHVVMPGHIGTSIAINSVAAHGGVDVARVRKLLARQGVPADQLSDDDIEQAVADRGRTFRDGAPTTAAAAATAILDAVRAGRWRILVGDDAEVLDRFVRDDPWAAYDAGFVDRLIAAGHFEGLVRP